MSFAFPAAWFFLAALPLIFALYLLRVRPREQSVPSLLLWNQVQRDALHRRWIGKARAWVSLFLQLFIFLLIVAALAAPHFQLTPAGAKIILLDVRGRMQATDGLGQSAFSKARNYAKRLVESASESSPIALMTLEESPRLISAFSTDPNRLRQALRSLTVGQGGGEETAARVFAQGMATALGARPEIFVLTDRPPSIPDDGATWLTFGTPKDNAGLTAAGARTANGLTSLFLRVTSYSTKPGEFRIEVEQSGRLMDSRTLSIKPDESHELHFELPVGAVTVRLLPEDALLTDQTLTLAPPTFAPRRVLLVSDGNEFVEKALRANEDIQFEMLSPNAWNPSLHSGFEVTLFDQKLPPNFERRGHEIFLNTAPGIGSESVKLPAVVEFDATHPVLRTVNPEHWRLSEQLRFTSEFPHQEIVTGTGGPLIVTTESPAARSVALLFPLEKSNLPLRASFPVFLQDLIAWTHPSSRPAPIATAELDVPGSDLRTATTSSLSLGLPTRWSGLAEWRWLALAAFGLLLIEWRTYHRRLTE